MASGRLEELIVGRVTFPVTNYLLNRRGILSTYRELMRSERLPEEALAELQLARLRSLLERAEKRVPFYARRLRECGFELGDLKELDDLRGIPPLTREDLYAHRADMVDRRHAASVQRAESGKRDPGAPIPFARFRRHRLVRNTSTGSTGMPTVFYEDGRLSALTWAEELRLKAWYGLPPGVREARITRVSTGHLGMSWSVRLRTRLWSHLTLPGVNLSDAEYEAGVALLEKFRPRVLWGVTSALTGFAEYLRRTERSARSIRPELAITRANPVYDHERRLLEDVFGCPVANIYGTKEVGHVAETCPDGSLHVNQEHYYVEIEPEPVGSSGVGQILVTTLAPGPMPFVRYRVGDVGALSVERCTCGRGLQVLSDLLGRTGEVLVTQQGRMISPNFWCRIFEYFPETEAVERYQVVYRRDGDIGVRIVPRPGYTESVEADLGRYIAKSLGDGTKVEFEHVPRLDPLPSGKYQVVVNERAS